MKRKLLFLFFFCISNFFLITQTTGQTPQVINSTGGASAALNDGLKIQVNTNGLLAVYRANQAQYCCASNVWPSGATGGVRLNFRFDNGTIYNSATRNLTACSTTPVLQVGNTYTTTISGYVESTIQDNGTYPTFYVTIDVTYTYPNNYFLVDYYVRAPEGLQTPQTLHLYLSHDSYILGKDGSRGYRVVNGTGEFVGDYRLATDDNNTCSGGSVTNPPYSQFPSTHGFKTQNGFRSYYSGQHSSQYNVNATTLMLLNIIGTTCVDDGVGVEFTIGPLSAQQTMAKQVLHGYGNVQGEFDNTPVNDPVVPPGPSNAVTVNLKSNSFTEAEGSSSHLANVVKIIVSGGSLAREQVCNFTISGVSAVQNVDYTYVKGFTIPAGDYSTPQEFTLNNITILGNTTCQDDRTFNINIDAPGFCNDLIVRGTTSTATYTIQEDETKPTINTALPNLTFHHGQTVPAITLTSTPGGATFSWTNTNTNIGLGANGTGGIPSFTANNATTSDITGTINVKGTLTCDGPVKTYTVTVKAKPTITYHYSGGTAPSTPNPTNYVYGPSFSIINEPTRGGYTFGGWICPELGISTPTKPLVVPANTSANLNLYADWGIDSYNITYNLNGGSILPPNPNPSVYDVTTPSFTLKNPERVGYTFTGWTGTGLGGATTTVTIPSGSTGNRTYTANWSENTYTINYNLSGGASPVTPNKSSYKITEVPFSINTTAATNQPTRTGYNFEGWVGQDIAVSTKTIQVTNSSFSINGHPENLTYTARWSTKLYTITYDLDGGIVGTSNPTSYEITTPTFTLNNPTRTGYTFAGWTGTGLGSVTSTVSVSTGSTGDRSYTANWTPIDYPITYVDDDGITIITAPGAPSQYNDTQLPLTFSSTPVKAGYTFTGWTGVGASVGATITIPSGTLGALRYEANWTAKAYTITYNSNGGTNPHIPSIWNGYNITDLPVNGISITPTYPGYTFKGWSGHGLTDELSPFNITNATPGVPGNLTFNAQWTLENYSITYDANGGALTPGNPTSYNVTDLPFTINTAPTHLNPDKKFIGWKCLQLSEPMQLNYTVPNGTIGNLDFKAHWSEPLNALNPGVINDTLYLCTAPKRLYGDPQAIRTDWILPDGSQISTKNVGASISGRYICNSDYGTLTVSDTLYVFFLTTENTRIEYVNMTGAKLNTTQVFSIFILPELQPYTTATWNVGDGVILSASPDTLKAMWKTTGEKSISVRLDLNYGSITCTQTLNYKIRIDMPSIGSFVNQNVVGGNKDGSSWSNAYKTIQDALKKATPGDRIWVAQGIYKTDLGKSFIINQDSVHIYGGFEGTEEYLYERNPSKYPTILEGNGNSVIDVRKADIRIDGFIIQGGTALNGAGIYFASGTSCTVDNCIIKENKATGKGGGIYADIPWFSHEKLIYINTEVSGNEASEGGGFYNNGDHSQLVNVTISGNKSEAGGGFYNNGGGVPMIQNSIIWGNVATKSTDLTKDIFNENGNPSYSHSIIGGSKGSGVQWNNILGVDSGNNYDKNPHFKLNGVQEDGVTLIKGNYRLTGLSQAIDKGYNKYVMIGIYTPWKIYLAAPKNSFIEGLIADLDYMNRISNDRVDIGAYEYESKSIGVAPIIRSVTLPSIKDAVTDPEEGTHLIRSMSDFIFTIYPGSSNFGKTPVVTTSRTSISDSEGIIIEKNEDGSFKVTIRQIQENIDIFVSFIVGNEVYTDTEIWSFDNRLHIKTIKPFTTIHIFNVDGKLYQKRQVTQGETIIPLPKGFYIISTDKHINKKITIN